MGCMRELAALRAACAQGEFVSERSLSRRDWGNFQYKKREFSIQDIIIYLHISSLYHCVSCVSSSCISYIMSLVDT